MVIEAVDQNFSKEPEFKPGIDRLLLYLTNLYLTLKVRR